MSKSEVYSWRVTPDLKQALEREARRSGKTVADLLDVMAIDWLAGRAPDKLDATEKTRAEAMRWVGSISGRNPRRAERAKELVREKLAGRRAG